jgi:hypothetical protein
VNKHKIFEFYVLTLSQHKGCCTNGGHVRKVQQILWKTCCNHEYVDKGTNIEILLFISIHFFHIMTSLFEHKIIFAK